MSIKFSFDERGFKKAIEKEVNAAVKGIAADGQKMLDGLHGLHRSHGGKPVAQVLPQVRTAFRRAGWKASETEMREYADAISAGTRIKLEPGRWR
jgi:hypothetical protein